MGSRDSWREAHEQVLLLVLLLVLISPPAVVLGVGGWIWLRQHPSGQTQIALGVGAGVGVALFLLLLSPWLSLLGQSWRALLSLLLTQTATARLWALVGGWALALPLAPVVSLLCYALPLPPIAQFQQQRRQATDTVQRVEQQARRRMQREALPQVPDALPLGAAAGGDLPWAQRGWLALPAGEMGHVVIIGEPGAGKTESILRLAVAARALGWQVLYLDGKGNEDTASRFLAAMHDAGCQRVAYFPTQPYDGWRGTAKDVFNRLLAIQPFSQEWYERVAHLVLGWAINAPPPQAWSSSAFLARLDSAALARLYKGQPQARRIRATPEEYIQGVQMRYEAFFLTVGGQLDGSWAFEDMEAAYLHLGGLAQKIEANSLGRFFLEEAAQYVVQRKAVGRQVLLIVDELSALAEAVNSAIDLFERSRFYATHVVVSSQSDAALGAEADRLFKAGNTLILHRYGYPEALLGKVGKELVLDQSWGADPWGQTTGRDVLRQREAWRVDPARVRGLSTGTAVVMASGHAGYVCVAPMVVSAAALRQAQQLVWGAAAGGPGPGPMPLPQPKLTRPLGGPGGGAPVQPPPQLPGSLP